MIQSIARSESQLGPEALELQQEGESWWELLKLEMPGYRARGETNPLNLHLQGLDARSSDHTVKYQLGDAHQRKGSRYVV